MYNMRIAVAALFVFLLAVPGLAEAQVLGPCGAPPGGEGTEAAIAPPSAGLTISPIPLPGQRALDFELTAVVGNDIRNIKLSDFQGKWRILCFFPAAFTFV